MEALSEPVGVIEAPSDWVPSDGVKQKLPPRTKSLKQIAIVYEDRANWVSRGVGQGLSESAAKEASYWLCDPYKIDYTKKALSNLGNRYGIEVELFEIDDFLGNIQRFVRGPRNKQSILWNITDGHASFRGSHLTSLATLFKLPYFGCPPFAQAIGQDKFKLYQLCQAIGVSVPSSDLVENGKIISSLRSNKEGPFFVKPNSFGNKVGLTGNSFCLSKNDALDHAREVGGALKSRMIIQKFINGPEIRLIFIDADRRAKRPKFGYGVVENIGASDFVEASARNSAYERYVDASIWTGMGSVRRGTVLREMARAVFKIARHLTLKDYFTFDFRLDSDGIPKVIDFNPGAFLFGGDVEGYAKHAFNRPLPEVLLQAMENSFKGFTCRFCNPQAGFRL